VPLHGTNRHARRDDSRDGLPGVDGRGVGSPLLFLHAQDEGVAPIASARALAGQWMNARFVAVSGADHQLLLKEPETSTALPRRISVYEEGGVTKLATVKPTAMIALYGTPELRGVAEEVEHTRYRSRSLGVRPPRGGAARRSCSRMYCCSNAFTVCQSRRSSFGWSVEASPPRRACRGRDRRGPSWLGRYVRRSHDCRTPQTPWAPLDLGPMGVPPPLVLA